MSFDPSRRISAPLQSHPRVPNPQVQLRSTGPSSLRQKHQSSNYAFNSSPLGAAAPTSSSSSPTFIAPNSVIPQLSAATNEILARVNSSNIKGTTPGWEAAREQVLSQMITCQNMPPPPPTTYGRKRGRGTKGASPAARGTIRVESRDVQLSGELGAATPSNEGSREATGRGRGRGRGRGGGRGGKRKRSGSDDDNDTDASETYSPHPTQSRSGRRILKPTPFSPALPEPDSPVTKRRRRPYRRNGEASVCKNCLRGHSPLSNMIVFCDGCNTPWHQHCHNPPIGSEVVQVQEQEWFCSACKALKEEGLALEGRSGGEDLTISEKRAYLKSLPHNQLVSLLLHASTLHPSLPIFMQDNKTAVDQTAPLDPTNVSSRSNEAMSSELRQDPSIDYGYDEDLPYPKAGNGIILPPESEDLEWLVDDDYETFSHTVHRLPVYMRDVALNRSRDAVGLMDTVIQGQLNGALSVGA